MSKLTMNKMEYSLIGAKKLIPAMASIIRQLILNNRKDLSTNDCLTIIFFSRLK